MENAPNNFNDANDIVMYQQGAWLSPLQAAMVIALERVDFFRFEIIRIRGAIQALPVDSVYTLAYLRRQLRYCLRSFRTHRRQAIRANRNWLNSFIEF
jgi:hypothetical protein